MTGFGSPLDRYLGRHAPGSVENTMWGQIKLRVTGYISDDVPPLAYVTSARCLVTKGANVLVHRDQNNTHVWPGGRRMGSESLAETARREVLVETGWQVGNLCYLGFVHFRHLTPKHAGYETPYPDFLQVVYTAEASEHLPDHQLHDGYEIGSDFVPAGQLDDFSLSAAERLLLRALRERRG